MPAGDRVGSVVVICPASRNGRAGTAPACTWPRDSVISSTESATCTVPGATTGVPRHGTGPSSAQSTLTVPGSSWNASIARAVARRDVAGVQQAAVEQRRGHVGDHGPASAVPAPAGGAYGGRAAAVDLDRDDLGAGVDLAAEALQPPGQRLR